MDGLVWANFVLAGARDTIEDNEYADIRSLVNNIVEQQAKTCQVMSLKDAWKMESDWSNGALTSFIQPIRVIVRTGNVSDKNWDGIIS